MPLDNTERLYLERQITLARVIFAALSLVALLETSTPGGQRAPLILLSVYLLAALGAAFGELFYSKGELRIPLAADLVMLAVLLYFRSSVSAFSFLFLFAVFALATRGKSRGVVALVGVATVCVVFRLALAGPFRWESVGHWLAIGLGTAVLGMGMGFLGAREREHLVQQQFLERVTGLLQFDRGLTESIRQALGELALEFNCEQACLAFRDDELERLFVWKIRPNDSDVAGPETLPLSRSETFLIDSLEVSYCWNFKNGSGDGFGWDRRFRPAIPQRPAAAGFDAGGVCRAGSAGHNH